MKRVLTLLMIFIFAVTVSAREHDNLVTATIKPGTATLEKGFYYTLGYNSSVSVTTRDIDGERINNNFGFKSFAITNFAMWAPGWKILGADYSMRASLALVSNRMSLNVTPGPGYISDSVTGLADVMFAPIALGWKFNRFDLSTQLGIYLPVGEYDKDAMSVGQDHWTFAPKLGGTFYFDQARTWAASALFTYELNMDNSELDLNQGNQLNVQYSFSKNVTPLILLALSGYATWKLEEDSGAAAGTDTKDSVYALGPEMEFIVPPIKTIIRVKYMHEFAAKNRSENNIFRLAASWSF